MNSAIITFVFTFALFTSGFVVGYIMAKDTYDTDKKPLSHL